MVSHLDAWIRSAEKRIWKGPYDLDYLRNTVYGRILDIGCGDGRHLIPLRRLGFDVVGIDLAIPSLRRIRRIQQDAPLVVGDARSLPFKDETFDCVISYDLLQHLIMDEREAAAKEMSRVLQCGGMAVLEVFGRQDVRYGGEEVEPHTFLRGDGTVMHYFTLEELGGLLREVGLEADVEEHLKSTSWGGLRHRIRAVCHKP